MFAMNRRVANDGHGARAGIRPRERSVAKRDHRRRLAAGDQVAELGRIGRLESPRLTGPNLAGAPATSTATPPVSRSADGIRTSGTSIAPSRAVFASPETTKE